MSSETPFFSVVIPSYNRADMVRGSIDSVRAQDFRDWEICIVDSARSTDDIGATVASYNDPRIRLETGFEGVASGGRNRGVQNARGQYIAFLDADDEFLPGKLSIFHREIQQHPDRLLCSQSYVDRGVGKFWIKPRRGPRDGEDIFDYLFIEKGWVHPSTVVVKREHALAHPWDESLSFGDDTQWTADMHRAGIHVRMIEQPLSMYYDVFDPTRLSQIPVAHLDDVPSLAAFVRWVESQRKHMSEHAWLAYRAGFLSRWTASMNRQEALGDILKAWRGSAISGKGAAAQLVQSFNPALYRRIADSVAKRRGIDPTTVQRTTPSA